METINLEVGETPVVRITTIGGDLRLTGHEGTTLEAQASPRGKLSVTPVEGRIEVTCLSACLIFLPVGARVDAKTIGGDMRVMGVIGGLEIGTVGGDLSLRRVGQASVERIGGDMAVHRATGDLDIGWVGGDVHIDRVDGNVGLKSGGGDLHLAYVSGVVQAAVGSDARLQFSPPKGSASAIQAGGDLSCRLPPKASVKLVLRAGGDLRAAVPGDRERTADGLVVRVGEAEATAELAAGGDLSVRTEDAQEEAEQGWDLGAGIARDVHTQLDAALAEVEAGLEEIGRGHFGYDAEHVRSRIRRAAERARRRAERTQRRHGVHAAGAGKSMTFDFGPFGTSKPSTSDEERLSVLQMLEQGTISVEEAEKLLRALEGES